MRSLTPAEARVILVLMAKSPGTERERAHQAGVPPTTYHAIRRRAITSGWLHERYIPTPHTVGADRVSFSVIQPFAERRADIVRRLRSLLTVVLLWASPDTILAVSFEHPGSDEKPDSANPGPMGLPGAWIRRGWTITCDSGADALPAYFDYSAEWAQLAGERPPDSYPQGLPLEGDKSPAPANSILEALLSRPLDRLGEPVGMLRFSARYLPRRERRLLDRRQVMYRVFPNFQEIPVYRGSRVERVALVTGLLRTGATLARLQLELREKCLVCPFLAASDGRRVIIGLLSPAPRRSQDQSTSVLSIFEARLNEIEVIREPVETLFPVVDHRYERLLSA
jgi:hypothetical protein